MLPKIAWDRHYANAAHASSQVSTSYPSTVQIILCKPCPSQSYILPGLPSNTKPAIAKLLHLFAFPTNFGEEQKTKKHLAFSGRATPFLRLARRSSSEILPFHATALRRYSSQRHIKLKELGPCDDDTTRSWKIQTTTVDSSFEPWA